jgi:histidinol phosphatase-like PHP family hydrolase
MAVGKRQQLLTDYLGGLAHVHTRKSNFPLHFESNMTAAWLVKTLATEGLMGQPDSPLGYIAFTEHVSNPGRPERLKLHSSRLRSLLEQRQTAFVHGVPVIHGHEVSILPTGELDMPKVLWGKSAIVIASRHRLAAPEQTEATQIEATMAAACSHPHVNILGHPTRNIEHVRDVPWERIFAAAARHTTAIEINLNIFPDRSLEPERFNYWTGWLGELARSSAQVAIGLDLHTQDQVKRFADDWDLAMGGMGRLAKSLSVVRDAGIGPERIVTASLERLGDWLHIDKDSSTQVSSE